MHERDNVAIVANDGGLPAGTVLPSGLTLRDQVGPAAATHATDLVRWERDPLAVFLHPYGRPLPVENVSDGAVCDEISTVAKVF